MHIKHALRDAFLEICTFLNDETSHVMHTLNSSYPGSYLRTSHQCLFMTCSLSRLRLGISRLRSTQEGFALGTFIVALSRWILVKDFEREISEHVWNWIGSDPNKFAHTKTLGCLTWVVHIAVVEHFRDQALI